MPATTKIPTVKLNDGRHMPILGLGTFLSVPVNQDEVPLVSQAVYDAIEAGYRHIDTAFVYTIEDKVGEAVKRAIDDGFVKREELFIVTKISPRRMTRDKVIEQTKESLGKLGLSYVDLMLVHTPFPMKESEAPRGPGWKPVFDEETNIYTETWPAMEEIQKQGLAKSVGVSNYSCNQIRELMKTAKVAPVTNQVECTPYMNQRKLKSVCGEYGIVLTAYSPFGGSPRKDTSDDWKESETKLSLFSNTVIKGIADKHKKSVAQILLKFHTQKGIVVIPKSVRKDRIVANADIFDFELSPEDMKALESLDKGEAGRRATFDFAKGHRYFPFPDEH